MEFVIYCLFDPRDDQPKYVGKAKNLQKRLSGHLGRELNQKHKRASWLKSLLALSLKPLVVVLDEVNSNEVNFWEEYYISLYRSWGFDLKNMTKGGDGGNTGMGRKQSECSINKRIETRRNNGRPWVSNERKEQVRQQMKGNKIHLGHTHSEITKQIIREKQKKRVTEEFKEKMREINVGNQNRKGKPMSKESKAKLQRPITQKDLNGNVVALFAGISEAIKLTGITGIANCLTGKSRTAGKCLWEYTV